MESRVIFSKKGKHRNGYLEEFPVDKQLDGEYSDEDDVFVEDPILDIAGATKPLMHPRKRTKVTSRRPECKCRLLFRPVLYFLLLVISLGGLMLLILYLMGNLKLGLDSTNYDSSTLENSFLIGCDTIEVDDVWVVGLPKLITESAFRLVDVNQDGTLDVILGFATGADGYDIPNIVCDIYFSGTQPCFGGLLALEGSTGKQLWRHFSQHELYGINCNVDINGDGVYDCLAGGRAGTFEAVSGKDGTLLWSFLDKEARNSVMNLYTAQFIPDVDGDGIPDVVAVHGGDPLQNPGSQYRLAGRIVMLSGKSGEVLQWVGVPDKREAYYSPQVYTQLDGTAIVLFGTGGETHPGSLWRISLVHLLKGQIEKAVKIYSDSHKGVMTPPVLVDITGDDVVDIIVPMFNSTVIAVDGSTFKLLWKYTFPMSESYNTPAAGYYNDDDVPDFMVKFSHGPGFPLYYYSETTVVDGRNGKPLITPPIRDTVGTQSSPLTVSMEGFGNDIFLHWVADCEEHEGEGGEYSFVKGTNVHEQSRSDFCRLRFKTNGFSRMYATGRHFQTPGVSVYYSGDRTKVEKAAWVNTTEEAIDFLREHPEHLEDYQYYRSLSQKAEKEKPSNKYNTEDRQKAKKHRGEFISSEAHYRNQMTSTGSKKGPALQNKYPSSHRDSYPRIPTDDDNDSYNLRRPGGGERPTDRWTNDDGYDDSAEDGQDDSYRNPMWYNMGRQQQQQQQQRPPLNPYYQSDDNANDNDDEDDVDYDNEENNYRRYPPYKYSDKRSKEKLRREEGRYYHMKHKRSVTGQTAQWLELFSRDNLESLEHKLLDELRHRHDVNDDEAVKRFFMKRRKRSSEEKNNVKEKVRERDRRHVGPHDNHGLQRLVSTGTIGPTTLSVDHPDYNHTVDVIFATYWFFPAKTQAILPQDQKCISAKLGKAKTRFDPKSRYYGMDEDEYEQTITQECLKDSGHAVHDDGVYESQSTYNPYDLHMGQMTVYRLRLKCTCSNATLTNPANQGKRCARILPYDKQQWPAYMGRNADSHWLPRRT